MRASFVVMPDVDVEDALQLAAVEDQDPVEALAPCAADPALDVRVRVRRPDWCSDHPDPVAIEDCVESAAGRPLELRGDRLVQPGRRLGAMPGAAIRIDLWVGRLRQRAVDSSPLAG